MSKRSQFSIVAPSILLASSILVGCSGDGNGGNTNNVTAKPPKEASASAAAAMLAAAMPAPIAYTPEPDAGVLTSCNIEQFDKSSFQSAPAEALLSAMHSVGGWIAAPQLVAPSFWLRLDDVTHNHYFQVPVVLSVKRPDVVSSINNPAVPLASGFALKLPIRAVPAGRYHLYLAAQTGGKINVCDNGRQVDFK